MPVVPVTIAVQSWRYQFNHPEVAGTALFTAECHYDDFLL